MYSTKYNLLRNIVMLSTLFAAPMATAGEDWLDAFGPEHKKELLEFLQKQNEQNKKSATLCWAVVKKLDKAVQTLLDKGFNVNTPWPVHENSSENNQQSCNHGDTPLIRAVLRRDFSIVKILLDGNADACLKGETDISPLEIAADKYLEFGDRHSCLIIQILLIHGRAPMTQSVFEKLRRTPAYHPMPGVDEENDNTRAGRRQVISNLLSQYEDRISFNN